MFNNAKIAKEVHEIVEEIFEENIGNQEDIKDSVKWLVYNLLLESSEYLEELIELGEYFIDKDDNIQKCIISAKSIHPNLPKKMIVECPYCKSTLEVTL